MKRLLSLVCLFLLLCGARGAFAFETHMPATAIYNALTQNPDWLNTARPLKAEDLKGRIILIDFWTYCCINCIHVIPKLQELEHEFGNRLTVIGIHSAKFATEGDTSHIREAVQKYGIMHPVVNDADFRIWNAFGVNAWPTVALIGPEGLLKNVYKGEGDIDEMRADIKKLIAKSGDKLVTTPLPLALEKDKIPSTVLRFPTKLTGEGDQLVISDSGHQQIKIIDLKTKRIIQTIGSGEKGFKDGALETAQFSDPQGVLLDGDNLFVADTGNHRLRLVDLQNKSVSTLAGTGKRGSYLLLGARDGAGTALASPWDLAFYPDKKTIMIANAGTHQLWAYDRNDKTLRILAGSGQESIDDGRLPGNSLSQPSGLSVADGKLYFVDAETSSLRVFDGTSITTLIGTGLFDFGQKDGARKDALMQHAIGVYADKNDIYIADTYNNALRKYQNGILTSLPAKGLTEPNGITKIGNRFFVSDTNNHRIVEIDAAGNIVAPLDILPMEKPVAFQENLPNILAMPLQNIAPESTIKIGLPEKWHVNKEAPNYLALFDADKKQVQNIAIQDIQNRLIPLKLALGHYTLQGILYYCEDKTGSQCLIRGINTGLDVVKEGDAIFTIALPVQE
ncbi:MAG: repeat family protein [Alphaproteobacteria bacterium]|nr:repeat family protein [Alphaproteobacteria bacterium]